MCGNKNRAVRHQQMNILHNSLLTGVTPLVGNLRDSGFNTRVDAVSNGGLKPNHVLPQYSNQVPIYPDDYKVYNQVDAPPAYEKVTSQQSPDVVTREMSQSTQNSAKIQRQVSQPMELPPQFQSGSAAVTKLVDGFANALIAYQAGGGRRSHVRRAQKALRNELYEEEVTRREALYGKLRCRQKSEIWKEVKAINFGY